MVPPSLSKIGAVEVKRSPMEVEEKTFFKCMVRFSSNVDTLSPSPQCVGVIISYLRQPRNMEEGAVMY